MGSHVIKGKPETKKEIENELISENPNHQKQFGQENYNLGNVHYMKSKYCEALPFFELAALQGNLPAILRLGRIYQAGDRGIKEDVRRARQLYGQVQPHHDWFLTRAERGTSDDRYSLAMYYQYVTKDYPNAIIFFKIAASEHHAAAQFNLAVNYVNGTGVDKNPEKAVDYYKMAADQGHAKAQFNLSVKFTDGKGVAQNHKEAIRYCRLAADQGHALALHNLAFKLEHAKGIEEDLAASVRFYVLSADAGHPRSQIKVAEIYSGTYTRDMGLVHQPKLVLKYYQLAFDQESADAVGKCGPGYQMGSRGACNRLMYLCLPILISSKRSFGYPELWRQVVLAILIQGARGHR